MRTMAYLHPTNDMAVATFERAYTNPRELVLRTDAEALKLLNSSLYQQRQSLEAVVASAVATMRVLVVEVMRNPAWKPGMDGRQTMTFDTWAVGKPRAEREAMERALRFIALRSGKPAFGNDWMDVLS